MRSALAFLVFIVTFTFAENLHAQLFGERQVGSTRAPTTRAPATRAQPPRAGGPSRFVGEGAATDDVGNLTGTERFIRGAREAGDFVGVDSGDKGSFVGVQAIDTAALIESTLPDVPIEAIPETDVNQAQTPPPRATMYRPRLRISFEFPQPRGELVSTDLTRRLESALRGRLGNRIEVSVEGETATILGEVLGERDRTLAQMWLLFEPGIANVQNRLSVRTPEIPAELSAVP